MGHYIYSNICKIQEVLPQIQEILKAKYTLAEEHAAKIIEKYLIPYFDTLRDDLYAVVEHPYIDKMYRDTYYSYYSSKLESYHRNSIRISFFDTKIEPSDFFDEDRKKQIEQNESYLGFLTLRPTFPKIIGRTAVSPRVKKENNIICCQAKINSTVNFVKYKISCFPHSSQDNQTISCAETTIWSLLEYFGNKYPEYKPVLSSAIHKILHKFSYKRLMPTDGLTAEQVTYAVRELGFGAVIYSRSKYPDSIDSVSFDSIISIYIESGIPVIGVLQNGTIGHAVNIIGREKEPPTKVLSAAPITYQNAEGQKINIIDFNKIERRYVLIDDNYPPYQLTTLKAPCQPYYSDSRWHDCTITNIIVPLYPRIYLEAVSARHNFFQYLKNPKIGILDEEPRIIKIFLASSRSYKEYIALNKNLDNKIKALFLGIAMPKFIWVAEVSKKSSLEKGLCDGIILQDATEPIQLSNNAPMLGNLSLIAGYLDTKFFTQHFGKFQGVTTFATPFEIYNYNLR